MEEEKHTKKRNEGYPPAAGRWKERAHLSAQPGWEIPKQQCFTWYVGRMDNGWLLTQSIDLPGVGRVLSACLHSVLQ